MLKAIACEFSGFDIWTTSKDLPAFVVSAIERDRWRSVRIRYRVKVNLTAAGTSHEPLFTTYGVVGMSI